MCKNNIIYKNTNTKLTFVNVNRFSYDGFWIFLGHFLDIHTTMSGCNENWALWANINYMLEKSNMLKQTYSIGSLQHYGKVIFSSLILPFCYHHSITDSTLFSSLFCN